MAKKQNQKVRTNPQTKPSREGLAKGNTKPRDSRGRQAPPPPPRTKK